MATLGPGIAVGHWTDAGARTGCTVVLFPVGTVASGEIRGGAPASRDFALLEPGRLVERLDAVVLSGGSAFGLSACAGVMEFLAAKAVGFETSGGPVPIVVGLSLFDLGVGDPTIRPGSAEGALAASVAATEFATGQVGAGTGATSNKWIDVDQAVDAGLGAATVAAGKLTVSALMAVNPAGTVGGADHAAAIADGSFDQWDTRAHTDEVFGNTTIGVVVTNGALGKVDCRMLAESAHDGLARAVFPPHRRTDGDAVVAAATGEVSGVDVEQVRAMTVVAVEQAIRACTAGQRL